VVEGYKSLSHVERAIRTLKMAELQVRPIYHRLSHRVRSHIFLCFLALYVEWHLREAWKPMLFDDEEPGRHMDDSVVRPALRSPEAIRKAQRQRRNDGRPVHSFRTLLDELSTVARNRVRVPGFPDMPPFDLVTTPNDIQREAFDRIGLTLSAKPCRQETSI